MSTPVIPNAPRERTVSRALTVVLTLLTVFGPINRTAYPTREDVLVAHLSPVTRCVSGNAVT